MKKLQIIILSAVGFYIVVFVVFLTLFIRANRYSESIYLNWSIDLPDSYREVYSADSGPSFHGDGERYHIFEYRNGDEINQALKWSKGKNALLEEEVNEILDKLNIPEEYMPDYDEEYKFSIKAKTDSSIIYLIYTPDTGRLYIIENIF